MNVIILGCGRVGSALALQLQAERHDVSVIDRNPQSRELLPASFHGRFIVGNGYSRHILAEAGLDAADAFVAVTSGDNTNIVAARIAKEDYRVPQVVARIYDPNRADIYHDLGIPTVASVRWTANRIHQILAHRSLEPDFTFGNGETLLVHGNPPGWYAGRALRDFNIPGEVQVAVVTRMGQSFLPDADSLTQPGDEVTFAVAATALGRLRSMLDRELGT